jgi:hypothetical protein
VGVVGEGAGEACAAGWGVGIEPSKTASCEGRPERSKLGHLPPAGRDNE